jgi:hypothetical protein
MLATGALRATARSIPRRRIWLGVSVVVFVNSVIQLANLSFRHTVGAELYGVLTAAIAVLAGAATIFLVAGGRKRFWATAGVLVLWAVVALGGIAGTAAHVVGPVPGHGPIDTRPRPIPAPLIFTVLGAAGANALFRGQRSIEPRAAEPEKE